MRFSGPVTVFHGIAFPTAATPAGYAALIDAYELNAPFPYTISAISEKHRTETTGASRLFTPRYAPDATLDAHLVFALKYEGVDLLVLYQLFAEIPQSDVAAIIRKTPTGKYARRIWFLYEWLTGHTLPIDNLSAGNYVPVLDPRTQLGITGERVRRQRVINNLPGTPDFCPLVHRSETVEAYLRQDLGLKARDTVSRIPADVVNRAASFLLLKDSRASFAIEGEAPPRGRIERWGRSIKDAGNRLLDAAELIRLQQVVIGDTPFIPLGYRTEGGFVGEHDRDTGNPVPEHISARPEDLTNLMHGLLVFANTISTQMDPVVAAAVAAFGFVFIHPFIDGNGRVHRYLIHHILARGGFSPPGLVFPVSATMLDNIGAYRAVLTRHSQRTLPFINWEPTADNNVRVLNATAPLYRFFDATPHVEFLFACIEKTVVDELPRETEFLERYDAFRRRIRCMVQMPDSTVNLLFRFLKQNDGRLSSRARRHEFAALTPEEADAVERVFGEVFENGESLLPEERGEILNGN